jgi:hypothetical protein
MKTDKEGNGYEIRIKGLLDARWRAWFEGWSITNLENGEALLKSTSVDQSGLHGALNKIRDLNLTLISVTSSGPSTQDSNKE